MTNNIKDLILESIRNKLSEETHDVSADQAMLLNTAAQLHGIMEMAGGPSKNEGEKLLKNVLNKIDNSNPYLKDFKKTLAKVDRYGKGLPAVEFAYDILSNEVDSKFADAVAGEEPNDIYKLSLVASKTDVFSRETIALWKQFLEVLKKFEKEEGSL